MSSTLTLLILVIASSHVVLCTELCKSKDWWYDIQSAKCRPCKICGEYSLVMEPCSDFMNTLCVDLREIGRSIHRNIEMGGRIAVEINNTKRPKWHEMEGKDGDAGVNAIDDVPLANAAVATAFEDFQNDWSHWSHVMLIVICITFFFVFGSIIIIIVRITGRRRYENRKNVARARLFSRDRLNTTEYMNNLATLDRRLAMDEILEKRKKAIFEPHLLQDNVYTDEVFVDISGLPRNLHDDNEYEELDHSRCLLRMQDQQ